MKVLDAAELHSGIAQIHEALESHYSEIVQIEAAVKGFSALKEEFKGKGGEAIRTFYEEIHIPLLTVYKDFIRDYEKRLEVMKSELKALESAEKGFIAEEFLTDEVRMGLKKVENETVTLTDEVNKAISAVADIVVLPRLDDSEFLTQLNKADNHRKDTIEALDQFDYEQSIGIRNLQTDLAKMQQYVNQVKTAFTSGKLQIDTFESGDLKNQGIDELIKTDVEANSCSREELELAEQKRIEDLKNKLINATSTEEYLKIANEIGFENLTEAQQGIVLELETGKQNLEILKGIGVGLFDAGKDLVTGVWDFVTKPEETVKGVIQTVIHPVETFNYIKKAITDSYERDMVNGDTYSRAHWVSYAVATVFGAKGAGAVAKTGINTAKAAVQKGAATAKDTIKKADITKYLPYSPQHQLVTPEGIPYNVVNSEGVKEKLISMARVETKSTGKDTLEVKFTREQLATKPLYSPVSEKWIKKGGTVKIDEDGTWVYTNKKGQTVRYPDGYPDFTDYSHPTVKPVEIEIASPTNRPLDYKKANIKAGLNKDSDPPVVSLNEAPEGYTWHHHQDGKTMILVDKKVHREFTHAGGVSIINGK